MNGLDGLNRLISKNTLDNFPNPILLINPDTSIRHVNPALEELTGYSADDLIGKKAPYPWWRKEAIRITLKRLEGSLESAMDEREELFQRKDGTEFWVEITSVPYQSEGKLEYMLANWIDITEQKRIEIELEAKKPYFDPDEIHILHELMLNPRETISQIAKTIEKTRLTTTNKLKRLFESKKAKIEVMVNTESLDLYYYKLIIQVVDHERMDELIELLESCPKVLTISQRVLDNSLEILLFEEKSSHIHNYSFSCMHFIEKLRSDLGTGKCTFETLLTPLSPTFMVLKSMLGRTSSDSSPCDEDCTICTHYPKICIGCPGTKYYHGILKFL